MLNWLLVVVVRLNDVTTSSDIPMLSYYWTHKHGLQQGARYKTNKVDEFTRLAWFKHKFSSPVLLTPVVPVHRQHWHRCCWPQCTAVTASYWFCMKYIGITATYGRDHSRIRGNSALCALYSGHCYNIQLGCARFVHGSPRLIPFKTVHRYWIKGMCFMGKSGVSMSNPDTITYEISVKTLMHKKSEII